MKLIDRLVTVVLFLVDLAISFANIIGFLFFGFFADTSAVYSVLLIIVLSVSGTLIALRNMARSGESGTSEKETRNFRILLLAINLILISVITISVI